MKPSPTTRTNQYTLFKDKLPRGQSYPINRTLLDSQLNRCGVKPINILSMSGADETSWCILAVDYCGLENHQAPTFDVRLSAVPSNMKHRYEQAIMELYFPKLHAWKQKLDMLSQTQLYHSKSLYLYYDSGAFDVSEDKRTKAPKQGMPADWFKIKTRMKRNSRHNSNKR